MLDRYGLLPGSIRRDYERAEMVDRQIAAAATLLAALRGLDENLDVVFFTDRADPSHGIVPGRWHVVRKNESTEDTYIPITTEDGGYREPDMGVYREMQQRDLWRAGALERELDRSAPVKEPAAHREPKPDDAIVEEIAHDIRAGARVAGEGGMKKRLWGRK